MLSPPSRSGFRLTNAVFRTAIAAACGPGIFGWRSFSAERSTAQTKLLGRCTLLPHLPSPFPPSPPHKELLHASLHRIRTTLEHDRQRAGTGQPSRRRCTCGTQEAKAVLACWKKTAVGFRPSGAALAEEPRCGASVAPQARRRKGAAAKHTASQAAAAAPPASPAPAQGAPSRTRPRIPGRRWACQVQQTHARLRFVATPHLRPSFWVWPSMFRATSVETMWVCYFVRETQCAAQIQQETGASDPNPTGTMRPQPDGHGQTPDLPGRTLGPVSPDATVKWRSRYSALSPPNARHSTANDHGRA